MDPEDRYLDGNAAAGLLYEVFGAEMTVNWSTCANCGANNQVGRLVAYMHGMGAVLRCPDCGSTLIRIAHPPGRYVLNFSGISLMEITKS